MSKIVYAVPAGFTRVQIGRFEFDIGRDPSHPGKRLYLHHSSVPPWDRLTGGDVYRQWMSIETFKQQTATAIVKVCRQIIKEIEEQS